MSASTAVTVEDKETARQPIMVRPLYLVAPSRFVLLELAEHCTGYTVKAMEKKIERGDWAEGLEYRRAPDGRIHIDLQGYEKWVMKGRR